MAGMSLGGLASGMDTDAVIGQLVALEGARRTRIAGKQVRLEARQSALNEVASQLRSLKTAADDLRSVTAWANKQTVESSNTAYVGARYTAGAAVGSYVVEVSQLARADQRYYTYTQDPGATQIDINGIVIDIAANATIDEAAAAINAKADSPAFASVVSGELVLSGKKTGEDLTVTASQLGEIGAKRRPSQLAAYTIDGVAQPASATNTITTALPGVELTLKAMTTGPVSVTVGAPGPDQAALKAKVTSFVDAYNKTIDVLRAKIDEKTVASPATTSDWKKGVLRGDAGLSSVLSRLRDAMGAIVPGDPGSPNPSAYNELGDVGIAVPSALSEGSVDKDRLLGKLKIDDAKLTAALTGDPTAVKRLFGGVTGVEGFSQKIDAIIDPVANTATGMLADRSTQVGSDIARIKDDLVRFDRNLESMEKRLRAQFTAMEKALSQSQSQTSWLSSQISGLSGLSSPSS